MLSKRGKQLHWLPPFPQASEITHTPDDVKEVLANWYYIYKDLQTWHILLVSI